MRHQNIERRIEVEVTGKPRESVASDQLPCPDFNRISQRLRSEWESPQGNEGLSWDVAKSAARDAWECVQDALIGTTTEKLSSR
jgi:hypothetical protein